MKKLLKSLEITVNGDKLIIDVSSIKEPVKKTIKKKVEKKIKPSSGNKKTLKGKKLRKFRISQNMTQSEFSKKAKMSASNLSSIESGSLKLTENMGMKIAKAFKVDINTFK